MFQLRPYQTAIAWEWSIVLSNYWLVYYAMEVRTGKTFVALETAKLSQAKNVLFITKIKAISSIKSDYEHYKSHFNLTIINKESVHKLDNQKQFDLIILDEAHWFWAFPKMGTHTKNVQKICKNQKIIFLSGTPHPESNAQIFHQFALSSFSPFKDFKNFYAWHKEFWTPKQIYTSYGISNDYSIVDYDRIKPYFQHVFFTFTQKEAGFETNIQENIEYVEMLPITYKLTNKLKNDLVIEWNEHTILADTAVSLQSKLHQMFSWTVKTESGSHITIDRSKAEYIKKRFSGKKLWIFYIYIQELEILKEVFGDSLTTDLEEFNKSEKLIALQIVSGREWISLSKADYLVFYNIAFSAVSYWQARDRLTTKDRKENTVFWIFAKWGIEDAIHKAVCNKKNFTTKIFQSWQKKQNFNPE